ncbi:hypothetical protein FXO38_27975 [Capsicum annuum]|nr:hypothetical protein FXO38_27975 [Capsicum annuum]KAF3637189.1 hypothetical protein FXO37_25042 [Capsicum annuum]
MQSKAMIWLGYITSSPPDSTNCSVFLRFLNYSCFPLSSIVGYLTDQFFNGEDIYSGKESAADDWLDIVTSLAWQAANYVKPDTSKEGSMDPVDYVKVKCIAPGSRSER